MNSFLPLVVSIYWHTLYSFGNVKCKFPFSIEKKSLDLTPKKLASQSSFTSLGSSSSYSDSSDISYNFFSNAPMVFREPSNDRSFSRLKSKFHQPHFGGSTKFRQILENASNRITRLEGIKYARLIEIRDNSSPNTFGDLNKPFKKEISEILKEIEKQFNILPPEVLKEGKLEEITKFLEKLSLVKFDSGLIEKLSSEFNSLCKKILTVRTEKLASDDELKAYKVLSRIVVELARVLTLFGGVKGTTILAQGDNVLKLLASEFQYIINSLEKPDLKKLYDVKKSYQELFQTSGHYLFSIFDSLDTENHERWNYLLDQMIVFDADVLLSDELKNKIIEHFPLSQYGAEDQIQIRTEIVNDLLGIEDFPKLRQIQQNINNQKCYFSLYYMLERLINYDKNQLELKNIQDGKLFRLLNQFLNDYFEKNQHFIINEDYNKILNFLYMFESIDKELSENEKKTSIYNLCKDWLVSFKSMTNKNPLVK